MAPGPGAPRDRAASFAAISAAISGRSRQRGSCCFSEAAPIIWPQKEHGFQEGGGMLAAAAVGAPEDGADVFGRAHVVQHCAKINH